MSELAEPALVEEQTKENKWTRHPQLYMEDGSIVLLAEDTLFRVYLRWLAQRSEVFAQMASFSAVQPSDAECYDGCPLVRITDTAEDFGYFLNAMDGCNGYFSFNKPTPYRVVAGTLRLSTKYMVAPLREKAIDHLCRLYPVKFADMNSDHAALRESVFGPAHDSPEHPIILLNLLHSCEVTKLLPWAYYNVVRRRFRDMVVGYKLSNDQTTHVCLSEADRQICLLGFETLIMKQYENIKSLFHSPSRNCKTPSACTDGIADAYTRALDKHAAGPIAPLDPLCQNISACDRCVAQIKRSDEKKRQDIWDGLPRVFNLPSWDVILS